MNSIGLKLGLGLNKHIGNMSGVFDGSTSYILTIQGRIITIQGYTLTIQ
jgi:hypothetical protein